jgi:hypothetical protein
VATVRFGYGGDFQQPSGLRVRAGRPWWSPPKDFTFRNAQNPVYKRVFGV